MKTIITFGIVAVLLSACGIIGSDSNHTSESAAASSTIDQFEVVSTADAFGGATPAGAAGPYTVITGIVHGKLDPKDPGNDGIVDLANAPVDANGLVSYTTDVVILRPKTASAARRVLFYDVVNRGLKLAQFYLIGGGSLATGPAPDSTFPSLLRAGYTVVWSGWQGDIAQSGNGATASVGTNFPSATNKDGTSITGLVREEYVPDIVGTPTIPLTYLPASMTDNSEVVFTARQTWINSTGQQDYAAPSAPVTTWSYVSNANGTVSVQFTPPVTVPGPSGTPVAPDAGTIYSFVYRAKNPKVMGIGFAAVRDLISFLRNSAADAKGNANPLNDLKNAACAAGTNCPANPSTNIDVALSEGFSQSGRFLRDFLYQGFNKDAKGNKVFDGLLSVISAGRRTWVNERFAQPGRWSKQHEDHWMPGDQFPFTYGVMTDPIGGANDGLLKNCLATSTCPKIMQLDGSFEWWGGRASLVVTDGAGHDIALPDNVRYYLIPGTQHSGGGGVTTGIVSQPAAGSVCQFATSPVVETPVMRALIPVLENWVVKNTAPPPSQYPTVASGNLVASARTSTGFPDLSNVLVPDGVAATPVAVNFLYSGFVNQVFVTDYSNAVPVANLSKQYTVLVPKVDANGNEISGIRVPEVAVPLATYTGWNLRGAGHASPELCYLSGSAIPLAINPAAKAPTDTRATLSSLYTGRADYIAKVGAAADALVTQGFLTAPDAATYKAGASSISAALIPAP